MTDDGPPTMGRAVSALQRIQDGLDRARSELAAAGRAEWVSAGADRYREALDDALADVARGAVALGRARWEVARHLEAAVAARDAAARERASWLITVPTFPFGGAPVVGTAPALGAAAVGGAGRSGPPAPSGS